MFILEMTIAAAAGLVMGSFLNMCIYRLPRDMSIIAPNSQCPKCGHKLSAFDLVPVLSYLMLGGRCRYCRERISIRYALVEILTALLFVSSILKFGMTYNALFAMVFISLLVLITFSDLETRIIPDQANYAGIAAGLIFNCFAGNIISSVAGAVMYPFIMYLIYKLGTFIYKKEAMGGGDIKLAAFLGAYFGWQNGLLCFFLSFIAGAVIGLFYLIFLGKGRKDEIPFGPAMTSAALAVLFYAPEIWMWYLGIR